MVQGEEPNLLEIEIHLGLEEQMFVCGVCITGKREPKLQLAGATLTNEGA